MKKINIINSGIITHAACFDTEQECLAWKENQHPNCDDFNLIDLRAEIESIEALKFLNDSDYKILRHVGQKALGISTTLSDEEYLNLEQARNVARNKII